MPEGFLLIRRSPLGKITAYADTVHPTAERAAVAAKGALIGSGVAGSANARLFADALARRPLATVWGHKSGYDFRVLAVDFTADGAPIMPGARLYNYYDAWWGVVPSAQFMHEGLMSPGGSAFDGWYDIVRERDAWTCRLNGERLATKELPHAHG